MKDLFVTPEMTKYQEIAKKTWAEKKAVDVDAVILGWKLHSGSVICYTDRVGEIDIVDLYADGGLVAVKVNGKDGKSNRATIANVVLNRPTKVYYSR